MLLKVKTVCVSDFRRTKNYIPFTYSKLERDKVMLNASYVTGNAGVRYLSLRLKKKGIKILFFRTWAEATPRARGATQMACIFGIKIAKARDEGTSNLGDLIDLQTHGKCIHDVYLLAPWLGTLYDS